MDPTKLPLDKRSQMFLPRGGRFHRKLRRDNIMGITRPAIRRLARRGGVVRMKHEIYDEIRNVIRDRLHEILRQVVEVLDSSRTHRHERKVITSRDVVYALNRMGNTVYGF